MNTIRNANKSSNISIIYMKFLDATASLDLGYESQSVSKNN